MLLLFGFDRDAGLDQQLGDFCIFRLYGHVVLTVASPEPNLFAIKGDLAYFPVFDRLYKVRITDFTTLQSPA